MATLPAMGATPSVIPDYNKTLVQCCICGKTMLHGEAITYPVDLGQTGHPAVAGMACPDQHLGCSSECAAQATILCLNEHIIPAHKAAVAAVSFAAGQKSALVQLAQVKAAAALARNDEVAAHDAQYRADMAAQLARLAAEEAAIEAAKHQAEDETNGPKVIITEEPPTPPESETPPVTIPPAPPTEETPPAESPAEAPAPEIPAATDPPAEPPAGVEPSEDEAPAEQAE